MVLSGWMFSCPDFNIYTHIYIQYINSYTRIYLFPGPLCVFVNPFGLPAIMNLGQLFGVRSDGSMAALIWAKSCPAWLGDLFLKDLSIWLVHTQQICHWTSEQSDELSDISFYLMTPLLIDEHISLGLHPYDKWHWVHSLRLYNHAKLATLCLAFGNPEFSHDSNRFGFRMSHHFGSQPVVGDHTPLIFSALEAITHPFCGQIHFFLTFSSAWKSVFQPVAVLQDALTSQTNETFSD